MVHTTRRRGALGIRPLRGRRNKRVLSRDTAFESRRTRLADVVAI